MSSIAKCQAREIKMSQIQGTEDAQAEGTYLIRLVCMLKAKLRRNSQSNRRRLSLHNTFHILLDMAPSSTLVITNGF